MLCCGLNDCKNYQDYFQHKYCYYDLACAGDNPLSFPPFFYNFTHKTKDLITVKVQHPPLTLVKPMLSFHKFYTLFITLNIDLAKLIPTADLEDERLLDFRLSCRIHLLFHHCWLRSLPPQ